MNAALRIAEQSHREIPVREGDFIQDGLWHCGICKTPKQFVKEMDGITINAMCLCKCEAEKRRKEAEAEERKHEEAELRRRKIFCFPSADMIEWNFANDDRKQDISFARKYVDHFTKARAEGKGLLLYGGVGTGKTYVAAAIANALIEQKKSVKLNTARGYADSAFDDKDGFIEMLHTMDLVILDDLSAERQTDYMQETVFTIVNTRYESKLPLIVTTNMDFQQIRNPDGLAQERIFSRIAAMCYPIPVAGSDRRKQMARDSLNEWKEVLYG
ncbi:MAG: ATP-binding protein [Mogibacterium sp.]|nr:ATP-binding protein [Mogibacterium sp.]